MQKNIKVMFGAAFLLLAVSAQAAERAGEKTISAGTIVDCVPTPGTAVIKSAMYLRETTEPAYPLPVKCQVSPAQSVPAQWAFVGEVRKVSRTRFAIVWQQVSLGKVDDAIAVDNSNGELITTEIRDTGLLRLTFIRSVSTDQVNK